MWNQFRPKSVRGANGGAATFLNARMQNHSHLVEVFLPLDRADGSEVSSEEIGGLIAGMADRFGGATAYTRAPAEGLWKPEGEIVRDRIIVVEIMVDQLDRRWWNDYRTRLQEAFLQDDILIRATSVERL